MSESNECVHEWVASNDSVFDGAWWVNGTTLACRWCRETLPCDKHGWVRVEDARPHESQPVETYSRDRLGWRIIVLSNTKDGWVDENDECNTSHVITHWRPLRPEPETNTDRGGV